MRRDRRQFKVAVDRRRVTLWYTQQAKFKDINITWGELIWADQ